jgi:hypothetical protein
MRLVAVLVGLEHYKQPQMDRSGPAANAIRIANWLLEREPGGADIRLFASIDGSDAKEATCKARALDDLEQKGVLVTRHGAWGAIRDCLNDLPTKARSGNHRLLLYWSGHGYARPDDERIWLCEDFTERNRENVIHGTFVCRKLRSYREFPEQLILVDTCATHEDFQFGNAGTPAERATTVSQNALFASAVGEYAYGDGKVGLFTERLLQALRAEKDWPSQAFCTRFFDACKGSDLPPYWLCLDADRSTRREKGVYPVRNRPQDLIPAATAKLLDALGLGVVRCRPHYRLTLQRLGVTDLRPATNVAAMLWQLAELGNVSSDRISAALLQFVLRLGTILEHKGAVDRWVRQAVRKKWASGGDVDDERRRLQAEEHNRVLLVDVRDHRGRPAAFRCLVQLMDFRAICSEPPGGEQTVADWSDLTQKLDEAIQGLLDRGMLYDNHFELHFRVDLQLFRLPFHRIVLSHAHFTTVGKQCVVILRYRSRVRSELWERGATQVRSMPPASVRLHRIPRATLPPADEEHGLHYAAFRLSEDVDEALLALLFYRIRHEHAAYVCWLDEIKAGHDWNDFEKSLRQWLGQIGQFEHFPSHLMKLRTRDGVQHALDATVLWDDPTFDEGETMLASTR